MKLSLVLLVLAIPTLAQAQNVTQIRRGTPVYFDHDEQSLIITERYGLCEDEITDATCKDIPAVRLQGTLTFQFALPSWVKNGAHIYVVRAFGEGEWSDPSNALTLQVTGKPLPPVNMRRDNPPPTNSTTTSTTTTTPVPASAGGGLRLKP